MNAFTSKIIKLSIVWFLLALVACNAGNKYEAAALKECGKYQGFELISMKTIDAPTPAFLSSKLDYEIEKAKKDLSEYSQALSVESNPQLKWIYPRADKEQALNQLKKRSASIKSIYNGINANQVNNEILVLTEFKARLADSPSELGTFKKILVYSKDKAELLDEISINMEERIRATIVNSALKDSLEFASLNFDSISAIVNDSIFKFALSSPSKI